MPPPRNSGIINAFTLAEVLITLGIIGVVAALTIPTLLGKYKNFVLEKQFKKAYSQLMQVHSSLLNEYSACAYEQTAEIQDFIMNKYKSVQKADYMDYKYASDIRTYNLNKASKDMHTFCLKPRKTWPAKGLISADGSYVATCSHGGNQSTYIAIDTNGNKKPNAFGHDIFMFRLNTQNCKLVYDVYTTRGLEEGEEDSKGYTNDKVCSKTSDSVGNGFNCAQYAVQDTCPDDSSKSYWECLP